MKEGRMEVQGLVARVPKETVVRCGEAKVL
jgi:hypothetical protein